MKFDRAKLTASAAILLLLAGYLVVFRPAETTIAARYLDLDRESARLEQMLAFSRRAPSLERERRRLRAGLDAYHVDDDRTRLVHRFLAAATAAATARDVHILEITSVGTQPIRQRAAVTPGPPATAATVAEAFDEVPLTVTVRGRYGALVRAARDLSSNSLALRISINSLVVRDRNAEPQPQLTATMHVTLLRTNDDRTIRTRPS